MRGFGFEKSLDATFSELCDRWMLLSQWSGRWGKSTDKAFAEYIGNLATDWSEIKKQVSEEAVLAVLKQRMNEWIGALQQDASKYIDDLGALTREKDMASRTLS